MYRSKKYVPMKIEKHIHTYAHRYSSQNILFNYIIISEGIKTRRRNKNSGVVPHSGLTCGDIVLQIKERGLELCNGKRNYQIGKQKIYVT